MRTCHKPGKTLALAGCLMFLGGAGIFAVEPAAEQGTLETKTAKGLKFKLPSDWPIEERNGVVGPIPIEEYLSRKFSAVESRIRALEQQASSLELKIRVLEEKIKQQQQTGLRSGEAAAP
jgi:hypothetical protein